MTGAPVLVHRLTPGRPGAPLVVFAHGLEDSWKSWLPLAAELDPDWSLVALDLPWRPGNDYGWRGRAAGQWLGDGLDRLDTTPDLLVAHSLGANATLELLCALDPRPGRAATLLCPLYRLPRQRLSWRLFERARATFVQHIRDGVRARMGTRTATIEPAVLETMMALALDRVGPAGFLAVFEQFVSSAHLRLDSVDLPTLVLAGGADATLSREAATALADGMPGGRIRIHEDYDHFCHVRHARGIAAQVADLVASVRATMRTTGELR
jgi:pimeloyl-ACP methyl ester carboxylesterase